MKRCPRVADLERSAKMRKPIALWVAPPLLLLKSVSCLYVGYFVASSPRAQKSMLIFTIVFGAITVLLFFKPRIGRWPAGLYYFFAMWLAIGEAVKPGVSPKDGAVAWISTALGCWLAYALLGSKSVKAYLDEQRRPNQALQPNSGAAPFADEALPPRG
jgi:hypothetical protein